MKFEKIKLLDMPDIYTVNAFLLNGKLHIGCGPEKQGSAMLIEFPSLKRVEAGNGPGGMMSLLPIPGRPDMLVSVMGLFPPFKGQEGGIFKHTYHENIWKAAKVVDMPFAHRCEIIRHKKEYYLFSSTVSSNKQEPSDWSKSGQVFLTRLNQPEQDQWETQLITDCIFKNHGMLKTMIGRKEAVCVSGTEGIFTFSFNDEGSVHTTRIFDKEVSEFTFIDINQDGHDELVTIEPFHGNSLNIYGKVNSDWQKIYETSLHFGHGLSSGIWSGKPCIAVGNRNEEASLELFMSANNHPHEIERICVEKHTGTTQTQFFHFEGKDYLLSANQHKSEAALYHLK